jgi:hypothetical protein
MKKLVVKLVSCRSIRIKQQLIVTIALTITSYALSSNIEQIHTKIGLKFKQQIVSKHILVGNFELFLFFRQTKYIILMWIYCVWIE